MWAYVHHIENGNVTVAFDCKLPVIHQQEEGIVAFRVNEVAEFDVGVICVQINKRTRYDVLCHVGRNKRLISVLQI